jgi:hypothetical protein
LKYAVLMKVDELKFRGGPGIGLQYVCPFNICKRSELSDPLPSGFSGSHISP